MNVLLHLSTFTVLNASDQQLFCCRLYHFMIVFFQFMPEIFDRIAVSWFYWRPPPSLPCAVSQSVASSDVCFASLLAINDNHPDTYFLKLTANSHSKEKHSLFLKVYKFQFYHVCWYQSRHELSLGVLLCDMKVVVYDFILLLSILVYIQGLQKDIASNRYFPTKMVSFIYSTKQMQHNTI